MSSLRNSKNWNRITRQEDGRDFQTDISLGRVPGMSTAIVVAYNPEIDISDGTVTIMDFPHHRMIFPTTMVNVYVSSDNAADTAVGIVVAGLDDEYNPIFLSGTLNGQTPVLLGQMFHIQSARMLLDTPLGDVYINRTNNITGGVPNVNDDILSFILQGTNLTRNAWYRVPKGFSAINTALRGSTDNATKTALLQTWITLPGDIQLRTATYTLSSAFSQFTFNPPVASVTNIGDVTRLLPAGTLVEFTGDAASNDTQVFFGIDFTLAEDGLFGGQPLT